MFPGLKWKKNDWQSRILAIYFENILSWQKSFLLQKLHQKVANIIEFGETN